jgi:hypothetical protein
MRVQACVAALALGGAACSLLAPLSDLRGSTDGGDGTDTGTPVGDGSTDRSAPPADGSTGRFCASVDAAFCDDFDDDDPKFSKWGMTNLKNGGAMELLTDGAASPPGFLRASVVMPTDPGAFATAGVQEIFGQRSALRLTARVRLPARPKTGVVQVQEVYSVGGDWGVYIESSAAGDSLIEEFVTDGSFVSHETLVSGTLKASTWTLVTLSVDLAGATMSAQYDGITVATLPLQGLASKTMSLRVQAGIAWADPASGAPIVDYDDVVVE